MDQQENRQAVTAAAGTRSETRRVCTRCLLRELVETDHEKQTEYEMIQKYRDAIKPSQRVADTVYEQRLDRCRSCEKLVAGTCMACGCYVELRAVSLRSHCPKKKW